MLSKQEIHDKIISFLETKFELDLADGLDEDTHLYEEGYIDSLESLVILSFIEKTFSISIAPDDLIENDLNTVNEMVGFIYARVQG